MAAPLVGLAIVGRYIAQKGMKKAIKKFGSKRVGQWKGRQTKPNDLKKPLKKNAKGKTYSIMGRKNVVAYRNKVGATGVASGFALSTASKQKDAEAKKKIKIVQLLVRLLLKLEKLAKKLLSLMVKHTIQN